MASWRFRKFEFDEACENSAPLARESRDAQSSATSDNTPSVDRDWVIDPVPLNTQRRSSPSANTSSTDCDWILPPMTVNMWMRRLWKKHFENLICTWLALLLSGQLGTTILWMSRLSRLQVLLAISLLGAACLLVRTSFFSLQMATTFIALALIAIPVLNVYSAIALFMPPPETIDCSCWEVLHVPTFIALAVMNLAESFPPVVKAEYGETTSLQKWLAVAPQVSSAARASCGCAAVLYSMFVFFIGSQQLCHWTNQPVTCAGVGPLAGRGLVLALHALGIVCGELHCRTWVAFQEDLPRVLSEKVIILARASGMTAPRRPVGADLLQMGAMVPQSGKSDSTPTPGKQVRQKVVALCDDEARRMAGTNVSSENTRGVGVTQFLNLTQRILGILSVFEDLVPLLRAATPPKEVVAMIVALQKSSPVLAPAIVALGQIRHSNYWAHVILFHGPLSAFLFFREVRHQLGIMPRPTLQRLALLVPNFYIAPSRRALLGYSLSTIKQMRKLSIAVRAVASFCWLPCNLVVSSFNLNGNGIDSTEG